LGIRVRQRAIREQARLARDQGLELGCSGLGNSIG